MFRLYHVGLRLDAGPLVTHCLPVQDVAAAFETVQNVQSGAVDVIVDIA